MSSRDDDMPPRSAEEQREADELRDALDEGRDELGAQLLAAMRPAELPDDVHERILARALGLSQPAVSGADDVALPASKTETAAACRLRDALAGAPLSDEAAAELELASLAHALKNAHAPASIAEIRNEALLRAALRLPRRRANRFASLAGALAVAAGIFGLWLVDRPEPPGAAANLQPVVEESELLPGMAPSRTTTDLFETEDFPQTGGQSSRIDTIARSRQQDLRKNRFVSWGVP